MLNSSIRIDNFQRQKISNLKFIYCDNGSDFKKYCVNPSAPAVTYLKFGSVIVLSGEAINLDIIAYEISHVELYERVGFYRFNCKIQSWLKHGGLTLQDLKFGLFLQTVDKNKN